MAADPYALAVAGAEALGEWAGLIEAAVVLGSGWQAAAEGLGETVAERPAAGLPGFVAPTVAGHGATVRVVEVSGRRLLVITGRVHAYEGHSAAEVAHPVRAAVLAGAGIVVLTNAAGALDAALRPGEVVLIRDQLNLTGTSPLTGPQPPARFGARFVDLTEVYSPRLREVARSVDRSLREGVYAGLVGPSYETPAEVAMLRRLGADLVGMSTVLEAIAARQLGAELLGVSLVTNLAAGVGDRPLDHAEVLEAGEQAAPALGRLLAGVTAAL